MLLLEKTQDDAKLMLFNTLNKMNNKNNDDNVKDIFLELEMLCLKNASKRNLFLQNNKNNFSEVLDAMSNLDNVSAYNDNQCMSQIRRNVGYL